MSSTNRGAVRNKDDFYATPAASVHSLLDRVGLELDNHNYGRWLEPAVGDGAILRAFDSHDSKLDPRWDTLDIHDAMPGGRFTKQNYLLFVPDENYEVIITNPPFFLAQEFIEHSLSIANGAVIIMLLRLGFLGSKKRAKWWQRREPDALYVLSERPDFTGQGGDSCDYAWFFWNWHQKGIFVLE